MDHKNDNETPSARNGSALSKIIHVDMDAFYAAIEQRDNPELKGRPVIVGGNPKGRGVVATCSYEARKFGIHSAMSSAQALRKCPHAIFIHPRKEVYAAVSIQIFSICQKFSSCIEPLSLDEAFLDVSEDILNLGSATRTAERLLEEIHKHTGLTASAGVSFNKFLAKVASEIHKPAGITVIRPEEAPAFLESLPVRKFFGVGKTTEKKMHKHGLFTGADIKAMGEEKLKALFGKAGKDFYTFAMGRDERPVMAQRIRKSMGREVTLESDIRDTDTMLAILKTLARDVEACLLRKKYAGHTLTLKVKYDNFCSITRSATFVRPLWRAEDIMENIPELLARTEAGKKAVRLLGLSISQFPETETEQTKGQMLLPFIFHKTTDCTPNKG
ncbi:DNA polymerase IV [Desulfobotulus mexicanus]|uniref:DNA polymerase IV n=1 Tax=Desulfobotulus mexicanus TaxID=2586642 RepID=A0A5S5MDG3_9BACT|nr:DNA polymerase IV [Desulfobotulus mexicanus]TYT73665.1 DNA polymerase IV [Desulfobotulus mexicanus]